MGTGHQLAVVTYWDGKLYCIGEGTEERKRRRGGEERRRMWDRGKSCNLYIDGVELQNIKMKNKKTKNRNVYVFYTLKL